MELIYLWIDKYKNIKDQGFNFSQNLNCKFDKNKNELTIKKNLKLPTDFFGKNIDIITFVGKNGSGKSNVIKSIFSLLYAEATKNIRNSMFESNNPYDNINAEKERLALFELLNDLKDSSFFLIVKVNNDYYKIDSKKLLESLFERGFRTLSLSNDRPFAKYEIKYKEYKDDETKEGDIKDFNHKVDSFFIYYNFGIDSWTTTNNKFWIEKIYHRTDEYSFPLLIEPPKYDNKIDLELIDFLQNQRILLFYSKFSNDLKDIGITNFFNPNKIKYNFAKSKEKFNILYDLKYENNELWSEESTVQYASKNETIIERLEKDYFKIIDKYIKFFEHLSFKEDINHATFIEHLDTINEILSLYDNKDYENLNLLYLAFKILEKEKFINEDFLKMLDNLVGILKDKLGIKAFLKEFRNMLNSINNFDNIIKKDTEKYLIKKIEAAYNFYIKKHYKFLEKYENNEIEITKLPKSEILNYFPAWLSVEFYEDEKSLSSLSTGEKYKFNFLINLLYQLNNLKNNKKYNNIYLILDEIEMGFHPDWQRYYLNDIIFSLQKLDIEKTISIIFLTHSPFILSDIPNENVIFMENGKNVSDKVEINTFGANIHTLLTHGFFMNNGLMGEFAREKIEDIIRFLNNEENNIKTHEEAEMLVSMIGEPVLKNSLKQMLNEKRYERLDNIEVEINELKKRLEELKRFKNRCENGANNNN